MAFKLIVLITALMGIALGQMTTKSPASTTPTTWIDPFAGCKSGHPGARTLVWKKSMDGIHEFVADIMAKLLMTVTPGELIFPLGAGSLIIKPPRVTEASYGKYDYDMVAPNRVRSRFYDGRMSANGVWQYKPSSGDLMGGTFTATLHDSELIAIDQLGRNFEAKPTLENIDCRANLSHFRIEIEGSEHVSVVEDSEDEISNMIRKTFESIICRLFNALVKEVLNRELQLVPSRMIINGDHKLEYGLLYGEPSVNDTEKSIRAGLEGKYNWRGYSGVSFNPPPMAVEDHGRMYSLQISDYTFNTLLHQAHSYGFRFSAAELLSSSSLKDQLSLNCDGAPTPTARSTVKMTTKPTPKPKPTKGTPKPDARKMRNGYGLEIQAPKCLGSLFANVSNFGPYASTDMGDVVFKSSSKAPAIYIESDKRAFFDGSIGTIEFLGPASAGGSRPQLAKADVRLMRGDFFPKLNKVNITGTIKLHTLHLSQSNMRSLSGEWFSAASALVTPMLTESFNTFFDRFAQFPIPLPDKYECVSPLFSVSGRSMQIDCDVQRKPKFRGNGEPCQDCTCTSNPAACGCPGTRFGSEGGK